MSAGEGPDCLIIFRGNRKNPGEEHFKWEKKSSGTAVSMWSGTA